ncbi:AAA domain-containing protein [Bacillus swezeyi]|uniref:AAA domain-containing protein n=1 Tax=Bacillus swezeyi TaxID=1925020 RepID=UPI002E1B009D|nr:AAA domain-containing protein [Bacillus swezeyi]
MENSATIIKDHEDWTDRISDWKLIKRQENNEHYIKVTLKTGGYQYWSLERCRIRPVRKIKIGEDEQVFLKQEIKEGIESIVVYGEKYAIVIFKNSKRSYIYHLKDVKKVILGNKRFKNYTDYFRYVAEEKDKTPNDIPPLKRQFKTLNIRVDSALYAYFEKKSKSLGDARNIIFPFGLNLSQIQAVESAFSSQISVIEGPPGTGKTQTILNLIANIIIKGQTAAVISNNNAAVSNVKEKLEKAGFSFLMASLGNKENQKQFFNQLPQVPGDINDWSIEPEKESELLHNIIEDTALIKDLFQLQNRQAILKQQIKDLKTERVYFKEHMRTQERLEPKLLPFYRFDNTKILNFMADEVMNNEKRMTFFKKMKYLLYYGLYNFKLMGDSLQKQKILTELQYKFYNQKIMELENELEQVNKTLRTKNFEEINKRIQEHSVLYFKSKIHQTQKRDFFVHFDQKNYKRSSNFNIFKRRFPIVLSTAFSLMDSIPSGYLFDYLIIDEASQLELVPGILALSCAKKVIIVGDTKQLPHIPDQKISSGMMGIEPCFDYAKHSMLHSILEVFKENIPVTLLKEHYRCHPMIIKFCNERYYNGELIPLTKTDDNSEPSIVLIKTAKGNHMRIFGNGSRYNIREIESLQEETIRDLTFSNDYQDIGFIAPYNGQINAANEYMEKEIIKNTVHKFQGRECDGIIFSTVLDKKARKIDIEFVDDSALINVAVSRAKKRFVLVSNVDIFKKSNKEISELIRYMEYYTESSLYHESNVISVFDLLYKEFSEVLLKRERKLKDSDSKFKSERIIANLLRDIFDEDKYKKFNFQRDYLLKDLLRKTSHLSPEEQKFIQTSAHCDFLIHYKMGNEPAGVIEVDGAAYHNKSNREQSRRDSLKDSILRKSGIPLLRLKTIESGEYNKVKEFLNSILTNG